MHFGDILAFSHLMGVIFEISVPENPQIFFHTHLLSGRQNFSPQPPSQGYILGGSIKIVINVQCYVPSRFLTS